MHETQFVLTIDVMRMFVKNEAKKHERPNVIENKCDWFHVIPVVCVENQVGHHSGNKISKQVVIRFFPFGQLENLFVLKKQRSKFQK